MHRISLLAGVVVLGLARMVPAGAEINVLTDLDTPFPPGCIALSLPDEPASGDNELVSEVLDVPSINSDVRDAEIRLQIWRTGCAEDGYSVVMVRMEHLSGDDVLVPEVYAEAGIIDYPDEIPFHRAQLMPLPAIGRAGATGNTVSPEGDTWMLGVEPLAIDEATDFFPADYNDAFTLELYWGDITPSGAGDGFFLDEYIADFDPPQFEHPVLHGRYTGQWVEPGTPRTGMSLNVGENLNDENFVYVIFFTYLDGQPFWVTGNTEGDVLEPGPVELDMFFVEGGEFFTQPGQPDSADLVEVPVGTLILEPRDCNTIRIEYDFAEGGLGTGSTNFQRLIRTAGYDCNPWE